MNSKRFLNCLYLYLTITLFMFITSPIQLASAEANKKYLVLVGQGDGTFRSYDDLAIVTEDKHIMVKAEPLAAALGLSYQKSSGDKKGCILLKGNEKIIFTRNSSTYDYYNNEEKYSKTADYKQILIDDVNMIPYASVIPLVNCSITDTTNNSYYKNQGYSGIIIYNNDEANPTLQETRLLYEKGKYIKIKECVIEPHIYKGTMVSSMLKISSSDKIVIDLTKVLKTYKEYKLPYDGVYGYGDCKNAVTIKATDKEGSVIGEINTQGKGFLINFPGASKLTISGNIYNLTISFTPVKPIIIADTTKVPISEINWIRAGDNIQQYFVLPENTQFISNYDNPVSILCRNVLQMSPNVDDPDYVNAYQTICVQYNDAISVIYSDNKYIEFEKMSKVIDNNSLSIYAGDKELMSSKYEEELLKMISALKSVDSKIYFPLENYNKKLIIKMLDGFAHTKNKEYIDINPDNVDLTDNLDYQKNLIKLACFYEEKSFHYGNQIDAWGEGNAIALSEQVWGYLDKADSSIFILSYGQKIDFLTKAEQLDFENYYLTVGGNHACIVGYQFTKYLQETYGQDVIYRILEKVDTANISVNEERNSKCDKQFVDCIKSVTSIRVFEDFVSECIDNYPATGSEKQNLQAVNVINKQSVVVTPCYEAFESKEFNKTITAVNAFFYTKFLKGNKEKGIILDLSEVLSAYKKFNLQVTNKEGVYGYGYCENPLIIYGIDAKGNVIAKKKTIKGNFLLEFPGAIKLNIVGNVSSLQMQFIPVKPYLISANTIITISSSEIEWVTPTDGFKLCYLILAEDISYRFIHSNDLEPKAIEPKDIERSTSPEIVYKTYRVFKYTYIESTLYKEWNKITIEFVKKR